MNQKILVTREPNRITARSVSFPEIVAIGSDESTVLEQIRKKLSHLMENSQVVEIALSGAENDPWLQFAGIWADDKNWDEFQAEVQTYRDSFDTVNG